MRKRTTRVTRRLNRELLRKWLQANTPQAASEPSAREKLVQACDYAFTVYLVDKILASGAAPNVNNRMRIARATGIPMDDLFPVVRRKTA